MSPLTKLFVVLLIICSLLLTAGMVVFVNQTENYRGSHEQASIRISGLERELQTAQSQARDAGVREADLSKQLLRTQTDLQKQLADLTQALRSKDAELNALQAKLAVRDASVEAQAKALELVQANLKGVQERYQEILTAYDDQRLAMAETLAANTDLTKQLEATERERQHYLEQFNQLRAESALSGTPAGARRGRVPAAPDITGRITGKQTQDGITYASIDVGSADRVQKGMEFNVIKPGTMEFLGKLTVEEVGPNEAFGRLEGPRIAEVQPEDRVMTQL